MKKPLVFSGWICFLAVMLFGRSAGRESRLVVGYGAVATAFLCGGPLPALWPLGGIALYLGLTRRPRGWRALGLGAGLSIVLGLALPWYGAMVERYGLAFTAHVFFFPYAAAARDSCRRPRMAARARPGRGSQAAPALPGVARTPVRRRGCRHHGNRVPRRLERKGQA